MAMHKIFLWSDRVNLGPKMHYCSKFQQIWSWFDLWNYIENVVVLGLVKEARKPKKVKEDEEVRNK